MKWRELVRPRALALAVAVAIVTLLGRAGSLWWVFDLLSHFAAQLVVVGAMLTALSGWARSKVGAGVAAASTLVNLVVVVPLYVGDASASAGRALTVMSFNVHAINEDKPAVEAFIEQSQCDLAFVLEVTPEWLRVLREVRGYRLVVAEPRSDSFGIALLARDPAVTAEIVHAPPNGVGFVAATVVVDERAWTVLGVHPVPPVGGDMTAERNVALDFISDWAAKQPGPTVVLGDVNTTPFSPSFRRLTASGKLISSQPGFGLQTSWPQTPWFLFAARIPIDHALHSPDLVTRAREVGPPNGSDHRPLLLTIALAEN